MKTLLIDNCTVADFELVCPKKWDELKRSYVESVRFCEQCKKNVYLCRSDADIKLYDSLHYCIAISEPLYSQRHTPSPSPAIEDRTNLAPTSQDGRVLFVGVWSKKVREDRGDANKS